MNNSTDIAKVLALHQAGDFIAARDGYLCILAQEPNNIEALHNLAILYAQHADFANAISYLKKAIQFAPNNPILHLNLGNALKSQGLFAEAIAALQQAITLKSDYATAINNLGTVYFLQEKLADAIQCYRSAITKQPDYFDAYYNLGLALTKNSEIKAAIDIYQTLIAAVPNHAAACFQIGCLLLQEERLTEALHYFQSIESAHPHHLETQTNLATCYLKMGILTEAKTHYLKALKLSPTDTQILFNIGVVNMQQGFTDNAIQYYQRALQINPNDFSAHNNIGVAFLAKNHIGYALHHFKEALRLEPNNKAIQYTVQMLSQNQHLQASPPEYIKNLFDAYADHYEPHLLQGLDYQLPTLFWEAMQTVLLKQPAPHWDIIDLGCGTGLCGEPFKSLAKTLTGIDLSPNMLEIAANKQIYSELIDADITIYLQEKIDCYDLMIAGDTLVYIGDLSTLFRLASQALRPTGYFIFNTEITTKSEYTMNQSGRFSHQKTYLESLARQFNFKPIYYQEVITRQQNNEPVAGHLFILQKKH